MSIDVNLSGNRKCQVVDFAACRMSSFVVRDTFFQNNNLISMAYTECVPRSDWAVGQKPCLGGGSGLSKCLVWLLSRLSSVCVLSRPLRKHFDLRVSE